jgi:serine/threonine-protein kinase
VTALRRQHENAPIPFDGLPSGLRSLAASGLAKSASQRPSDAVAFLAALEKAALGAYGDDWERRGKARLARRVALLALLLPLGGAAIGGSAFARTVLGPGRWAFAAGLLAVLLAGGSGRQR